MIESVASWFLGTLLAGASLFGAARFFGDKIADWLLARSKHKFDLKLEEYRADAARELESFRSKLGRSGAAWQALASGIVDRRLAALEETFEMLSLFAHSAEIFIEQHTPSPENVRLFDERFKAFHRILQTKAIYFPEPLGSNLNAFFGKFRDFASQKAIWRHTPADDWDEASKQAARQFIFDRINFVREESPKLRKSLCEEFQRAMGIAEVAKFEFESN